MRTHSYGMQMSCVNIFSTGRYSLTGMVKQIICKTINNRKMKKPIITLAITALTADSCGANIPSGMYHSV